MVIKNISITFRDFQLAYRKLKSTVYYDSSNTNLFLRKKLAHWERDDEDNANDLTMRINRKIKVLYNAYTSRNKKYFLKLISQIDYHFLPKKIKTGLSELPENVLINKRTHSSYEFEKVNFFIDAPVELHIISVLWLLKYGYKLDKNLDDFCFGNRLILNDNQSGIVSGLSLFKPYFLQYQDWRDKGIQKAQQLLNENKDIVFINLDIQNYYYSARINLDELKNELDISSLNNSLLNDILFRVYKKYTSLIIATQYPSNELYYNLNTDKEVLLPIGLLSSNTLANWYLNKFDQNVREILNPAYFSRYVDDIFVIIENPKVRSIFKNFDYKLITKYFGEILIPRQVETKIRRSKKKFYEYYLSGYDKLKIQQEKVLVYYFSHNESTSVIDKLKRDLDERSSEFRYLPEYGDNIDFDKEAYELIYDDSIGKIKTLKDYKENRYGLSSILAKRIFAALRVDSDSTNIGLESMLRFFKGENLLSFYTLWEKLFTYFVVLDKKKEFKQLYNEIRKILNSRISIANLPDLKFNVKSHLEQHLSISLDLAFALNPNFLKELNEDNFEFESNYYIYRISNFIRDKYITHSLLNYSNYATKDLSSSLIDRHLSLNKKKKSRNNQFGINDEFISYSPRKIRFYEATLFTIRHILSTKSLRSISEKNNPLLLSGTSANYLYKSFELYCKINFPNISNDAKKSMRRKIFRYKSNDKTNQIHIPDDQVLKFLRVAVANTKVSENNIIASILNTPQDIRTRYNIFSDLSRQTSKEKSQLLVLPENFLPYDLLDLIAKYSYQQQIALITGLEHWIINNIGYNFIVTILPIKINGMNDAIVIIRLKNHYAPKEKEILRGYRRRIPKTNPKKYDLIIWKGLYFSSYYCYELCNINHRGIFKSKVDFLVSSEWNPDTNYFSNIVESTARDVHCYFIQVNTPQYGDSRITCPKKTELKDLLKLKGGDNHTILTGTLNITDLREYQLKEYNLQQLDNNFKPTPPNFNKKNVRLRIKNRSMLR